MISVIVPIYNIEKYVTKCILSIINQTYSNLEIILVDDGSTDTSGLICDHFATKDNRIRVIHKANGGLSDARNCGVDLANGKYIAFVDGDDWIESVMYEQMIKLQEIHQADIVICRCRRIYRDRIIDQSSGKVTIFNRDKLLEVYFKGGNSYSIDISVCNKLFLREMISFLRFPKGKWYEDNIYTVKALSNAKKTVYIDQGFYNYLKDREGSITFSGINNRTITDLIPALSGVTKHLEKIGLQKLAYLNEYRILMRLLDIYETIYFSKTPNRKKNNYRIYNIIRKKCKRKDWAFIESYMSDSEKRKVKLFLKSPKLFLWLQLMEKKLFCHFNAILEIIKRYS